MKKATPKLIALLALLLIFSMLTPMPAQAATTYYLTVMLSGPDQNYVTQQVGGDSSKYNTLESKIGPEAVSAMVSDAYTQEVETKFDNTGMRSVYYEALDALAAGSDAWADYLTRYDFSYEDKNIIENYYSTFADLKAVGGTTSVTCPGRLGIYTVTVTLHTYSTGNGKKPTEPTEPTEPIIVVSAGDSEKDGGTVEISNPTAAVGEAVTLIAKPNEKKMINYVDVRDKNGKKVPLTYNGNGSYTFVMPEGGVTVKATFRAEPADPKETGVAALLDTDGHRAFMIGDTKGDFRPNDNINRAEVSMIFYRLLRNQMVGRNAKFADVNSQAWYAEAVETLATLGIIKGNGNNNFQPMRAITRAEFAAICTRFAKSWVGGNTFTDVGNHWASREISTAAAYGWIYGYEDGSFAPNKPITRQEAASIVNRMLYRLGDQIEIDAGHHMDFPDVNDNMWGWYEIAEATYGHGYEHESRFVHEFWEGR